MINLSAFKNNSVQKLQRAPWSVVARALWSLCGMATCSSRVFAWFRNSAIDHYRNWLPNTKESEIPVRIHVVSVRGKSKIFQLACNVWQGFGFYLFMYLCFVKCFPYCQYYIRANVLNVVEKLLSSCIQHMIMNA